MKNLITVLFMVIVICTASLAMDIYFKDTQYSFQLLRAMAGAVSGYSDIGECLKTAYRIKEGDDEGWLNEWRKTAREVEKAGDKFLKNGHRLSASQAYLRASNYYRSAEFFHHTQSIWQKSKDMFLKSISLMDYPIVKPVKIPFEGTTLPGYLCLADNLGTKRPLLIVHTGFDGTGEELYSQIAVQAIKRGYNCLIFEGPGQGEVIRVQKIPFRYNWETVVTPVVDYAESLPEVDKNRIALMGISFGGYLAPRAAAFEPRIKACIANGGVWDFHQNFVKNRPPGFEKMLDNPEAAKKIDEGIYGIMEADPSLRWVFDNGMFTFGAKSPSELIRMTRPYTMAGVAEKIKCRMLIVDSEGDKDMPGQAKKLYQALRCPKEYMLFTKEEGAEEHCQIGAYLISSERIFNWLDNNL